MNIGFWQLLFVIFICFLLFGDISNVTQNLNVVFHKLKKFLTNNK